MLTLKANPRHGVMARIATNPYAVPCQCFRADFKPRYEEHYKIVDRLDDADI